VAEKRIQGREQTEERSLTGSVAAQFLSSVPEGAGLTVGGLVAKDAYAKVKQTVSSGKPKEK
jgi:hypothetical protein